MQSLGNASTRTHPLSGIQTRAPENARAQTLDMDTAAPGPKQKHQGSGTRLQETAWHPHTGDTVPGHLSSTPWMFASTLNRPQSQSGRPSFHRGCVRVSHHGTTARREAPSMHPTQPAQCGSERDKMGQVYQVLTLTLRYS